MATAEDVLLDAAVDSIVAEIPTISFLKKEQKQALCAFVSGKDVCAFLPTGFGKSLIYQLAPLVVEKVQKLQRNAIVIIVSPLVALMDNQVAEAVKLGLTAVKLGDNDDEIMNGNYQLVFGSPESWLLNSKWRGMLSSKVYRERLAGIVVDEVHATYKWGEGVKGKQAFRETFSKLGELRSLVPEGTPVLALTASAETKYRDRVTKLLHMDAAVQVTVSPNRTNIRLGLCTAPSHDLGCLDWIVKMIKDKALSMAPIIIYCRSLKVVGKIFCHLKAELGEEAWVHQDKDQTSENLLIGMFHSKTLQRHKDRVLRSLNGDGHCRVVVATTALGMGLNFPNVSHVVMYGSPEDVEAIVQQVGRAGRDGSQAHAVLYTTTESRYDVTVKELLAKAKKSCFRQALYTYFEDYTAIVTPGHLCCTFCQSQCTCDKNSCLASSPPYESFADNSETELKCRRVTSAEKLTVKECLEEYMSSLNAKAEHTFTSKALCTGFSRELVDAVLEHCVHIFDINYIVNNLPVFRLEHAREILLIISEVFGDFEYEHTASPEEPLPDLDLYFKGYFDKEDDYSDRAQNSSEDSDVWSD